MKISDKSSQRNQNYKPQVRDFEFMISEWCHAIQMKEHFINVANFLNKLPIIDPKGEKNCNKQWINLELLILEHNLHLSNLNCKKLKKATNMTTAKLKNEWRIALIISRYFFRPSYHSVFSCNQLRKSSRENNHWEVNWVVIHTHIILKYIVAFLFVFHATKKLKLNAGI